jgi:hypothetical protein
MTTTTSGRDDAPADPPRSVALEFYRPGMSSIELAVPAFALAQRIASTEFVPESLRNRPEAVLASILAGHEVGIGPMTSLAKIHVIKGRPAMAAELMRAIILRAGHELWFEELSSTKVRIAGRRADSERITHVEWNLDDARRAGLLGRDAWKQYPRAMLIARATGELARAIFADVLAGLSYTPEELEDGDLFDVEIPPGMGDEARAIDRATATPAKRTARARKAATRGAAAQAKTEPDPTPKVQREEPLLPGEDEPAAAVAETGSTADDEIVEGELVDDDGNTIVDEPAPADPLADGYGYEGPDQELRGKTYTGPQIIAIKVGEAGITDRADRIRLVSIIAGREISSTKDLSTEEIENVIRFLNDEERPPLDALLDDADEAAAAETESTGPRTGPDPDSWTDDAWRTFLRDRGVKVTEVIREAQRLASEDGDRGPATLADFVSSSSPAMKALVRGFVEETAAARGAGS